MTIRKTEIEGIISPKNHYEFLGLVVLNIATNLISSNFDQYYSKIASALFITVLWLSWWYVNRQKAKLLGFQPQKDTKPDPAEGLILLVSPFNSQRKLNLETWLEQHASSFENTSKLIIDDFKELFLYESNLRPLLESIEHHKDKLHNIWLLSTQSTDKVKGSDKTALVLKSYLGKRYPNITVIYTDPVPEWDYSKVFYSAEKIFREASLKGKHIIADITGGNKVMSVSLALACIPKNRRMQYILCDRDEYGNPLPPGSTIYPLLVDIDPILIPKEETDK